MEGFQIPRKTARLQFEGEEFEGCEIVAALDLTLEATQHMESLRAMIAASKDGAEETSVAEQFNALMTFFSENCIVSWNLVDAEGKELPLSAKTFLQFPGWFMTQVMNGWGEALREVSGVDAPLDDPSKNGSTSEGESVMTEAQSSVLPS